MKRSPKWEIVKNQLIPRSRLSCPAKKSECQLRLGRIPFWNRIVSISISGSTCFSWPWPSAPSWFCIPNVSRLQVGWIWFCSSRLVSSGLSGGFCSRLRHTLFCCVGHFHRHGHLEIQKTILRSLCTSGTRNPYFARFARWLIAPCGPFGARSCQADGVRCQLKDLGTVKRTGRSLVEG